MAKKLIQDEWYIKAPNGVMINYLSEEGIINMIDIDIFYIAHVKNPSEKVQIAAISQDINAYEYIDNPSKTVTGIYRLHKI